jgi:hypothetical protein
MTRASAGMGIALYVKSISEAVGLMRQTGVER